MTATAPPREPAMDHRFRARRREVVAERVRRRRRLVMSLALLVALAAVTTVVARSPLFDITAVDVSGVRGARAELVQQIAGIRVGDNLVTADLAAARERIDTLPWVRRVDVRRVPPATVLIDVRPRRPAAVVEIVGATWTVDTQGVVMAGGRRPGVPVVTAPNSVLPGPGARVTDAAVRNALDVHAALPAGLRRAVQRYEAPSERGLRFLLQTEDAVAIGGERGVWVRFGLAERVDAKAAVIASLLGQAREQMSLAAEQDQPALPEIAEVDVRAPRNPVLVPRAAGM